jgi:hypothetical protein
VRYLIPNPLNPVPCAEPEIRQTFAKKTSSVILVTAQTRNCAQWVKTSSPLLMLVLGETGAQR